MKIINDILIYFGLKEKPKIKSIKSKQPMRNRRQQIEYDLEKAIKKGDETEQQMLYYDLAKEQGYGKKETFIEKAYPKLNRNITFNFIPKKQANKNVRSLLEFKTGSFSKWQEIRNFNQENFNNKCCVCNCSSKSYGKKYDTECHEEWIFGVDEEYNNVQKLKELQALCIMCHKIKHLNQEFNEQIKRVLLERYAEINKIDLLKAKEDYDNEIKKMDELDTKRFVLELKALEKYGVNQKERYFNCNTTEFEEFIKSYREE